MSGIANMPRAKSGVVNRGITETVTLYIKPTQGNSGQTISFATWDFARSWTPNWSRWLSYSGEDVTLQKGLYNITFQMTNDHIGQDTSYHHRIYCRNSSASSPGKALSQAYGLASGTHSAQEPLTAIITTPVAVKVKCGTYDHSDGHSLYFGSDNADHVGGSYSFLQIIRHNDHNQPLASFDQNND